MNCILISFIAFFVLISSSSGKAAQCTALKEDSSTQELLEFLRSSKELPQEKRDGECIDFAIRHLEHKPSPEAETLLIDYLGFERPLSQAERAGFMLHGPITESNTHPAMGTLLTFGKSAVPALLSSIEESPSEAFRGTATHTLMLIFRDQPPMGIEYLKQRSTHAEPINAARLKEAARTAIQWCGDKYKQQCDAALAR